MMHAALVLAAAASLHTVSASDRTASVAVPAGWSVVKSGNGYIGLKGPKNETIALGALVVIKNAGAGAVSGEVAFAMPFSASGAAKFTKIVQTGAAKSGMAKPQVAIASESRARLPMCEHLLGSSSVNGAPTKFEGVICSMQPDYLGLYKNLVFMLQVRAADAAADRPVVEQIAGSYRVTPAMFKKMMAPYTPLPPAGTFHGGRLPQIAPYQDPTNADCFDYTVIREAPPWEMPMHCGGTQPG